MKSFASLARLGLLALVCCGASVSDGNPPEIAPVDVGSAEPPLLAPPPGPVIGPALAVPAPDCLPKDPAPPVLKIKVRVPAFNSPGQPIEYRICVENCSTAEAHHVLLKNPLPANARYVRADPEPSAIAPELQWQLGTIGGGACREVVLVLQPTNQEDVKNCTRVQFEHGQCVTTRQSGYAPGIVAPSGAVPPVAPPGTAPGIVAPGTVPPGTTPGAPGTMPKITEETMPQLALMIEGQKRQYVNLGSHYFITVRNTGKTKATNLLVSGVLPEQTKFVRASANWKFDGGQVAWVLGDLPAGAQRTVEVVVKAQAEGEYCVRATVRADRGATAQADACTQFIGVSAISVEMSDRDDPLLVGAKTSYRILIRNPGSAAVTKVKLKAFIPPGLRLLDVKGPTKFQAGEKAADGQWLETAVLARLEPMTNQTYEIFVEAQRPGVTRLHVEVSADQLERGPVIEEESTTLFADEPPNK